MANKRVRVTRLDTLENSRPVAPGDEITVSEREAQRLIEKGAAVALPAPARKTTTKTKEVGDAPAGS